MVAATRDTMEQCAQTRKVLCPDSFPSSRKEAVRAFELREPLGWYACYRIALHFCQMVMCVLVHERYTIISLLLSEK